MPAPTVSGSRRTFSRLKSITLTRTVTGKHYASLLFDTEQAAPALLKDVDTTKVVVSAHGGLRKSPARRRLLPEKWEASPVARQRLGWGAVTYPLSHHAHRRSRRRSW